MASLKNPIWILIAIAFLPGAALAQETKLLDSVTIEWKGDLEVTKEYYEKLGKEAPEKLAETVNGIRFVFNKDQTFLFENASLKTKREGKFSVKSTDEKNNQLTIAMSYIDGLPLNDLTLKLDKLAERTILVITAERMENALVLVESSD